jgi:hypothetical protein
LDEISRQHLGEIIRILKDAKEHASTDLGEAQAYLETLTKRGFKSFSLSPDRKRAERPHRVGLEALDLDIARVRVRIEGDEPHNGSSLIRLDEADFALAGLDELLIVNQQYMYHNGFFVRSFGNHNYQLARSTDVLVAGSANLYTSDGLQDFIGMFLIGHSRKEGKDIQELVNDGVRIFVKGRYEGLVLNAFPDAKTVVVEDVEDAVLSNEHSYGIELVQTGSTIKEKGLFVYGSPLFLSETLLVVNYGRFGENSDLQRVVEAFSPQGYFDNDRVDNFADWYHVISGNLGENWLDRPDVGDLFVTGDDIINGLRPYNTQSRDWEASDSLPVRQGDEQLNYILAAKDRVREKYFQNLTGGVSSDELASRVADHILQHPDEVQALVQGTK